MPQRVATTDPPLPTECFVVFDLLYFVTPVPDESIHIDATLHSTIHYIRILQSSVREGAGGEGGCNAVVGDGRERKKPEVDGMADIDQTTLGRANSSR